jgi:3-oxoacyl-[acyl-carrier protein] reductase
MGRNIVITGASSRIGQAIFDQLYDSEDLYLLQGFRNTESLKKIKKKNTICCNVDFQDPLSLDSFLKEIVQADILVNVAAITITGALPLMSDPDIQKMVTVNITAMTKICQAVIPGMVSKRKGIIINLSSVAATRGVRGQSVYSGTKGYMESLTRAIAAEYGKKGIQANCVAPGPIEAGSLEELLTVAPEEVKKSTASGKLGHTDDVAHMVSFLCSDKARFINGKTIGVDGGYNIGV